MRRRSFASPRRRALAIAILVVAIVLLFSLRSLAVLWTDQLWFSSEHISSVFSTLLEVKIGLGVTFGILFFLVLFGNLLLADRLGTRDLSFEPDDEVVRRFQEFIRPFARRAYAVIAALAGVVAGLSATGQWNNYLRFANARNFGRTDPLFHKDIGFYVFRLPFLSFIVNWALASLIVVIVVTAIFHYLNGGIRTARESPRVQPMVKVHLSVLLAVVAIVKAIGYILAKWDLVVSTNGYVEGAGYADVHARMPALTILFILSLAAAAILLYNIRRRGWSLPALAVGLWVFVAVAIGIIYPAALQTFQVTPSQATDELPYIQRNMIETKYAYQLDNVTYKNFSASPTITTAQLHSAAATLNNIRLWDPDNSITLKTVQKLQATRSYYTFTSLGVDRYILNGKVTPVLIGARQVNYGSLPAQTWINQHLIYTHGNGSVILPSNTYDAATSSPIFAMSNVPPVSQFGLPTLTTTGAGVYFGENLGGWVVANTKQKELDYEQNRSGGQQFKTHYAGSGGVAIGGFLRRTAFALRMGDLNLFLSNQITSKSRIIFVRDVTQMAQMAAPFLSWDAHPYAVVANGHVKFILDGYTTTAMFPYSEDASSQNVPTDNGLPGSYNYVRNSVKLVVDAYDGSMKFYAADPKDPILQAYRAAFPTMFRPLSDMPASVRAHLKYPADLFAIQTATLGRYHIPTPAAFYSASDRWEVSPTAGAGSPKQTLQKTVQTDAQGNKISSSLSPMDPLYQVLNLPGQTRQQLIVSDEFIPAGNSSTIQSLSAFAMATMDPDDYGHLTVFTTNRDTTVTGPAQSDSFMQQATAVSTIITYLDQHGTKVLLGNNLMIPVAKSLLYIRPLYVSSTSNSLPELKYVIANFNQNVGIAHTLDGALALVFGTSSGGGSPPPNNGNQSVATYLHDASVAYQNAQSALTRGDLAAYQSDVNAMNRYIDLAVAALSKKG